MKNDRVRHLYQFLLELSNRCNNVFGAVAILPNDIVDIKNDLIFISQDVQKIYPTIGSELFRLKDNLFTLQGTINPIILGELIALLRFLNSSQENNDFWKMVHPTIEKVSKGLFENGHYANAAEDAFVELNDRVKEIYMKLNPKAERIPDGVGIMNVVFSDNKPILELADISTEMGKNIQKGYMFLFSGAMSALRNPKAHKNICISEDECKRRLVFASMLMYKLEEGK